MDHSGMAADLTKDEALKVWSGSSYTYAVGKASGTAYVAVDGGVVATSALSKELGHGAWSIRDDGSLCVTWKDQPRWHDGCAPLIPLGGNSYKNGAVTMELFADMDKFSLKGK
ncbi:MAG: hypothetical protein HXX19_10880 [Rhodoferax sp.]|nr:hypothetical protein [Rhodoferax sp.]